MSSATDAVNDDRLFAGVMQDADLFSLLQKHRDKFSRITFWAVHDGQSWRNYWPITGRTEYPMLFDRHCQPKPALDAVIKVALGKS